MVDHNEDDSDEHALSAEAWRERLKQSMERGLAGHVISEQQLFALLENDDCD